MMKKTLFLLLATLCVLSTAVYGQDPVPDPPLEDDPVRVETEEIKLNVSAFDRFGEFVSGVTRDDLVIIEDGRLHQANSVRRIPASVLIVLDTGGELRQVKNITQTRNAAIELVKALDSSNSIAVIEYHDKARILTEWTTNKLRVISDLEKKLIFGRRSIFSEALGMAREYLSESEAENRHLVLITDGTDSYWSDERRQAELTGILGTNINVHVVSYTKMEIEVVEPKTKGVQQGSTKQAIPPEIVETLPNGVRDIANAPRAVSVNTDKEFIKTMKERRDALEKSEDYLEGLSADTNGLFLLPDTTEEMIEKCSLIANVIDSNYVVTYTPRRPLAEAEPGEVRDIEVSSKKPGLRVLAKRKLVVGAYRNPVQ